MRNLVYLFAIAFLISACERKAIVIQTDFGTKDGAVAAMKGVAYSVDKNLQLFDLTHEIPAYNVWEAAYRLNQATSFWPAGTVFVSVVDPGVGTQRKSIVLQTRSGHYFISPDNGTLTLVAESLGIKAVREIDEARNRRKQSDRSYTFHGRDVYIYTAARLASGKISFKEVGPELADSIFMIPYQKAVFENGVLKGNIPVLDIQFGNVWTNIPDSLVQKAGLQFGDSITVEIFHDTASKFRDRVPLVKTFGEVTEGNTLAYFNSLLNFSLAINMRSFADSFHIGSGAKWTIHVSE